MPGRARPAPPAQPPPLPQPALGAEHTDRPSGGQLAQPAARLLTLLRPPRKAEVPGMDADFLVVGSGIAGLTCALRCAASGTVLLVTKDRLPESSSQYAQGGIASVWSPDDSFESHIEDTLRAGAGLCHLDVVSTVVSEGPERVRDLIRVGGHFDGREDPEGWAYDLGQEGGHSQRRILHALDATGHEIIRALSEAVRATPGIRILENHLAVDLLLDRSIEPSVCWGA